MSMAEDVRQPYSSEDQCSSSGLSMEMLETTPITPWDTNISVANFLDNLLNHHEEWINFTLGAAACSVFITLAIPYIFYLTKSKICVPKHSALSLAKMVLSLLVVMMNAIEAIKQYRTEDESNTTYYSTMTTTYSLRAAAMIIAAILQEATRGRQSCTLLRIFWLFSTTESLITYSKYIQQANQNWFSLDAVSILPVLLTAQCVCSFIPERSAKPSSEHSEPGEVAENTEAKAGLFSRITFGWHTKFIVDGYTKPVDKKGLCPLAEQETSSVVVPKFERYWKDEVDKSLRSRESLKRNRGKAFNALMRTKSLEEEVCRPNLVKTLFKSFGWKWGVACMFSVVEDATQFLKPILLREFIAFINDSNEPTYKGVVLAVGLYLASSAKGMLCQQWIFRIDALGNNVKAALTDAIYKKALRLSNAARQTSNIGEVVNLMSIDAERFEDNAQYLPMVWSVPFQCSAALYLLWTLLGPSVIAGLAVMILLIPINAAMAKRQRNLLEEEEKFKDERMKQMNEVLNGIKVLKFYGWENSFYKNVQGTRNKDLNTKKSRAKLDAFGSIFWDCSATMVSLATFAVYNLSSSDNTLDPEKVFVSMSLFHMLHDPIGHIPDLVASLSQLSVSIKRLQNFFANEELDEANVDYVNECKDAISIEDGTFVWDYECEVPTLNNINLHVKEGSLVAIVGAVGTGKSSLLSAILGEIGKENGKVQVKGSIAYVGQQAWIQNATLKENILFFNNYDADTYSNVVNGCALAPDFEILAAGDQTEIGEKGINLSGGQKQRVNLARAVYSDKDTYLLDDPLSAVDAHVGKHIFNEVIGHDGLLRNKTRVLVTHNIWCLPFVDNIIVLMDGKISEMGTYTELLEKQGDFSEFLTNHGALSQNCLQNGAHGNEESAAESLTPHQGDELEDEEDGNLFEEETNEAGTVKLKNIIVYLQSFGTWTSLTMITLYALIEVNDTICDLWLADWSMDSSQSADTVAFTKYYRLGVYALFGLLQALIVSSATVVLAIGNLRASKTIHSNLLMAVLRAPMSFFDITPIGRIVNRFAKDIDAIDDDIPNTIRDAVTNLSQILTTMTILSFYSPYILIAVPPLGLLYLMVQRVYATTSRQVDRLLSASHSPVYSHFSETLQGAQTIRAYKLTDHFVRQSQQHVDYNNQCRYNLWSMHRWLSIRLEGIANIIMLCAALFAVAARGQLTPGFAGIIITYALDLTDQLNWFVFDSAHLENHIVSVERIREYLEMPREAPWVVENKRPVSEWPQTGTVNFENYSTRYRDGLDLVLKGINAKVSGGKKIGIVGRTGAGKSSLTMALFRMIEPVDGKITIDGVDTREIGLHDLRQKLTIIPQDPVLFSGSLRMNLDPFDMYSNDELWTALQHSHLKTFVESLTSGLEHDIAEGGENLSVGQRQLVCLARALLKKTKILVMDEATAAVDLETDKLIQNTIHTQFSDCTVFTIAHRLNTIINYNTIMVFDKGQIIEYAPPDELLADRSSLFHSMAKDAGLLDQTDSRPL